MRKISTVRAKLLYLYNKLRKSFLVEHRFCEARLEGCTIAATEVHHKAGREGKRLVDTSKWLALCHNCHKFITEHSKFAIENGYSDRRNT